MKRFFLLAVLVVGLSTAASCSRRVIARINGEKITYDEFIRELEHSPVAAEVLNGMLINRLIEREAEKKGIKVTDEEVTQLLNKQKESVGGAWEQQLKMSGMGEADVRKMLRRRILTWKVFVSEDDARKFFEENKSLFDTPAQVRFRRMVLASKDEAEKTRRLILEGKAKFEDVAKEKSLEQWSAARGGEIGPTPVAAYVAAQPQLKDILEKQPLNEISEPVQHNIPAGSYQIVQVLERIPAVKAKFEDKRFEVYALAMNARMNEISRTMTDLQATATVEILDPRFAGLLEQWKMLKERKPTLGPGPTGPPQPPSAPKPETDQKPGPGKPGASGGSNVAPAKGEQNAPAAPKAGQ